MGACIALCSAMVLSSVGGALPANLVETAYAEEVANTVKKTFTADQLTFNWGNATNELVNGQWNITFAKKYDEVKWKLPESVDLSVVKSVTFKVAEQSGTISLKVYNNGNEMSDDTLYGKSGKTEYTMNPTNGEGAIDYVGIMTTDTENFGSVKLVSVTFEMNAEASTELEYTADKLTKVHAGGAEGTSCELTENKWAVQLKHDATNGYPQAVWTLPESVELSKVNSVKFNVENQTGAVALKLGMDNGNGWYDDVEATYGNDGAAQYTITPKKTTGTFDRVVVMTTESDASLDLISVVVELDSNKAKPEIEKDIPDWKDTITADGVLGSNGIAGTAIMSSEITDDTLMGLVEKHFNAVTFGNELKPDALFNYQIGRSVSTKTITFKGQQLEVPVVNDNGESLDFSRADEMAAKIMEWNTLHPDKKIRIRGHVLVWHSQTPEWFFCKNYDMSKGYVDKDTMNLRLEWFISSVFEHYFGSDSGQKKSAGKYADLFYGWDVVNEAVIGNGYRQGYEIADANDTSESDTRHGTNSCWWRVYNSNEFIINAFKYANTYAPSDVELYYNDFGETDNTKCEGIVQLIKDVKAAEGTRLDAFGMQAHYNVDGFSAAQFKNVAEKYIEAAGKVQLTELDFKASSTYDGSAAAKESEYTKIAYCHKNLFEAIKGLNESGSKVSGLTVWGVIEPNSWLQSSSNVGGGANGSAQCPLLFDGNYKAKPAFWAYVDASKLQPAIQKITITEAKNGKISGETYSIDQGEVQASFIPAWDKDGLTVLVNVKDTTVDTNDSVTVYVDPDNSASDVTPVKKTVTRAEANESADGYQATVKIPMSGLKVAQKISMDVVVANNGQGGSFNDLTGKQETSSKYYAVATVKPGVEKITYGTITVDGEEDAAWKGAVTIPLTINIGSKVSADAKVLWDNNNLYVYAVIKDSVLDKTGGEKHEQDSLEVFIDEDNGKTVSYGEDDKQYRINYLNEQSFNGKKCNAENVSSVTKQITGGYVVEAAFKWTDITPENGTKIGLEFQINDANDGKRTGTLSWYDETGMGWSGSNVYGTVELVNKTSGNGGSISGGSSGSGGSVVQPETKPDAGNETMPDGSKVENSKVEITISGDKKIEVSVSVSKDQNGKVTGASATVSGTKGQISAETAGKIAEAAGTNSVAIAVEVKDSKGNVKYTVTTDSKNLTDNVAMKVFVINEKTGAYELVNGKTYKTDKDGNLNFSLAKGGDYTLLSTKEAAKIEKAILKTVAPKKTKATVKKGKATTLALSSELNINNVKKITYKSSKKSVATVNKKGKITAKKKGTAFVMATVTLKNGKTKTVSMKITVK